MVPAEGLDGVCVSAAAIIIVLLGSSSNSSSSSDLLLLFPMLFLLSSSSSTFDASIDEVDTSESIGRKSSEFSESSD